MAPTFDYTYDGIMRSFEQSCQRLAMHRIDVVLIHDVDVTHHGESVDEVFKTVMDSGYRALEDLRGGGEIRAIGVGVNEADMCARFARAGDFDCMLLAGRYTLYEQGALDEFLPLAEEKDIGIIVGGILATGPGSAARYNYGPAPDEVKATVQRIEAVCRRHDVPLAAAAIQFALGHPSVSTVCIGMEETEQIDDNIALMRQPISAALWQELKDEKLLRAEAPVPNRN
jgi:D-threo-aldose 1-dehydrogenase